MKSLLLLLLVSVALAAPQQEVKPRGESPPPAGDEKITSEAPAEKAEAPAEEAEAPAEEAEAPAEEAKAPAEEAEAPAEEAEAPAEEVEAPAEEAEAPAEEAEAPAEEAEAPAEEEEAPAEEAESVTEAASTGGKLKSTIGDQAALDQLAQDFEALEQSGGLPVAVGASPPSKDEKFGAKVNIFGVDVPVIVLAKLGLAIVAAAAAAIGGGGTAAAAAALGEGVSFPDASDPDAVSRILRDTTDTAAAIFDGDVVGEVYFAQARRSEAAPAATVITAKFSGVPVGAYQLEVRQRGDINDACTNVGPRHTSYQVNEDAVLGSLLVDEGGQASAILSSRNAQLSGTSSILGRSIVLVSAESDAVPVACAVIVHQ